MRQTAIFALSAALLAASAVADEETVVLRNGDRITGEVLSLQDGTFHLRTTYGELRVPKKQVVRIEFVRDPLERFLPDDPTLKGVVETLRGKSVDGAEVDADLLRTAMDVIESYRKIGEGKDQEGRLEELRRRLESILPRFRGEPARPEKEPRPEEKPR